MFEKNELVFTFKNKDVLVTFWDSENYVKMYIFFVEYLLGERDCKVKRNLTQLNLYARVPDRVFIVHSYNSYWKIVIVLIGV